MTLLVDAAAGAVVDGERRWPLRLDCRTGAAVVTFGDRELAIAPLQWRHKQRLARWAHLGPDFVTSQRAALALDPADEWEADDVRVVAAVAEFLDARDAAARPRPAGRGGDRGLPGDGPRSRRRSTIATPTTSSRSGVSAPGPPMWRRSRRPRVPSARPAPIRGPIPRASSSSPTRRSRCGDPTPTPTPRSSRLASTTSGPSARALPDVAGARGGGRRHLAVG